MTCTITDVAVTEERRLVSLLFADLVGFTAPADSSDPKIVREIQRDYFGAVAEIVERLVRLR